MVFALVGATVIAYGAMTKFVLTKTTAHLK
ncbi:Uncharacterised protein [Kurthia zopfii]|uniref:Uncharacterized protein n=1 Tax=Kurthia zopfii TaxID=1650 RepID=A0A8B4Q9K8_9BACL|nr:hypothetical protein DFR61_12027 [Kurthia zopfii]STX09394.1 Uncharacterised protein [Kurthia zopfii]VEI06374.1 Uncharacterised protein [Kurthia zopfii]